MGVAELRRKLRDCLDFGGFDPARAEVFEHGVDALLGSADVAAAFRTLIDDVASAPAGNGLLRVG